MKTCSYCRNSWPDTREQCKTCGACLPVPRSTPRLFVDRGLLRQQQNCSSLGGGGIYQLGQQQAAPLSDLFSYASWQQ